MDTDVRTNYIVSVIIPAYNSGLFIKETIDSVINQSYSNWEIIIVDDGSTDNTKDLILSYVENSQKIKYVYQSNKGQAAARNTGIAIAEGDYLAFLDSDDIWLPEKLTIQLECIKSNNADIVFSDSSIFPTININETSSLSQKGLLKGKSFFIELFLKSSITNSSVLIKKNIFNTVGLFDEAPLLRGTEDWEMWLRLAKAGYSFFGIDKKLVNYRIHERGTHLNNLQMYRGKLAIYDKYNLDKSIPNCIKLKQCRFIFRELVNYTYENGNTQEIQLLIKRLLSYDKYGLATNIQAIAIKLLPVKYFISFSNKLVYRFFYRLENYHYNILKWL